VLQAHNCCSLFVPLCFEPSQLLSFQLLLLFWHFIECQFWCVRWRCLVFSLFFFALMSIISLFFYIEICYLAPLHCIVCALCVCLLSKWGFKGCLSFIESKSLTLTKFALDVNFKNHHLAYDSCFRVWSLNVYIVVLMVYIVGIFCLGTSCVFNVVTS